MPMRLLPVLLLVLGCNATGSSDSRDDEKREFRPPPLAGDLPPGALHRTSRPATFGDMLDELADADVVYVGEEPGEADHQLLQQKVIEYLLDRGRLHGIGMTVFERRHQKVLDDYVHQRIDEAALIERTGWDEAWPHDFAHYRPVLAYARRQRLGITALGVDRAIAAAVAAGGLDALTAEQRAALPATSAATLANDVIANGIVAWFRGRPKDVQLVVLAATGRIAPRSGLPQQVHGRNGKSFRTVVPVGEDPVASDFAEDFADFVWVAGTR